MKIRYSNIETYCVFVGQTTIRKPISQTDTHFNQMRESLHDADGTRCNMQVISQHSTKRHLPGRGPRSLRWVNNLKHRRLPVNARNSTYSDFAYPIGLLRKV